MRTTIKKWFWAWDFDKEENWLNKMASQGLALVAVGFCNYTFEDSMPGEYTIRLELLENTPAHIESQKYIKFLEDTQAEYIGSVFRWAFFRKKNELGSFNLYSDMDSRIKHLDRLLLLIGIMACANLPNAINITHIGIKSGESFPLICGLLVLSLITLLGYGFFKVVRKKKKLQKEQKVFE